MSRIEELQGRRWAKDVCEATVLDRVIGTDGLIKVLERGLVEKPEGYKKGVLEIIEIVRSVKDDGADTGQAARAVS
jgi:hypothetical protein